MSSRRGFTLIELLVVIAIISLLVSILLPSLARANGLAKTILCQSNLKGFTTVTAMYTHDHEWLPNAYWWRASNWVSIYVREFEGGTGGYDHSLGPSKCFISTSRNTVSLFECPTGVDTGEHWLDISYYYNGQLGHGVPPVTANHRARRIDEIDYPSELTLICDGTVKFRATQVMTNQNAGPHWRHQERLNTTWADGHVEVVPWDHPGHFTNVWYGWWGWPWATRY